MPPAPKFSAQQQLDMVIDAAVHCIESSSLLSFTMSAVAKKAGLSMGSVYKQVQSKEDLFIALAVRMMDHQSAVFSRVMALPMTTPEILIAFNLINPLKTHYYSFDDELDLLVSSRSILERASPGWLQQMIQSGQQCEQQFAQLIDQAIENNEVSNDGQDNESLRLEIETGGWALQQGYMQSVLKHRTLSHYGLNEPLPFPLTTDDYLVRNTHRLLNTYHWQTPLTNAGIEKAARLLTEIGYR